MRSATNTFSQRLLKVEAKHRRVLAREHLAALSAEAVASQLQELLEHSLRGGERSVWYAMADAFLAGILPSGRVPLVYRAAVDAGADLAAREESGFGLLDAAAYQGRAEAVQLLKQHNDLDMNRKYHGSAD